MLTVVAEEEKCLLKEKGEEDLLLCLLLNFRQGRDEKRLPRGTSDAGTRSRSHSTAA